MTDCKNCVCGPHGLRSMHCHRPINKGEQQMNNDEKKYAQAAAQAQQALLQQSINENNYNTLNPYETDSAQRLRREVLKLQEENARLKAELEASQKTSALLHDAFKGALDSTRLIRELMARKGEQQ